MWRQLLVTMLTFGALSVGAVAHPHVWTDMRSSVIVNDQGLITGIRMEWTFDTGYSGFALEGLDVNGDGEFSHDELQPLTKENIANLVESNYFTVMRQSDAILAQAPVTDYGQIYENGRLQLYFILPLAKPVDPRAAEFQYKIYDPEFFIAFDYMKEDPVDLEGTLPKGCNFDLKPLPTDEEIDQTRAFLATKGTDWKPDTEEDFGSMFAQAAVISCKQ